MLYSVYIGGQDTHAESDETGMQLSAKARIAQNKAIRSGIAAVLTQKAAPQSFSSLPSGDLEIKKEAKVKVKKEKKEPTPEELKQKEFQTDCSKFLSCLDSMHPIVSRSILCV